MSHSLAPTAPRTIARFKKNELRRTLDPCPQGGTAQQGVCRLSIGKDAVIQEFADLAPNEPVFIRPCSDDKSFAGRVIEPDALLQWQKQVQDVTDPDSTLTPKTPVLAATPKPIPREFRFFVVDARVVAGSLYREAGRLRCSSDCDQTAWAFAQRAASAWQPDSALVIDLAVTPEGPKIIEINCLNSAAFYDADLDLLVDALERTLADSSIATNHYQANEFYN